MRPQTITPGMFGYSLLRANENREFFKALMVEMGAFGIPIEGLHTETGPGVYEAAILFSEALEQADRAILFKTGAKEIGSRFGIMPSFMAKWSAQYPGCSGHIHQSMSDGKKNLFYDAKGRNGMSRMFESYVAGQVAGLMEFAPMYWPTINSYKRLVDGFWAPVKPTWGARQPHRELSRHRRIAQIDAPRDALPRRRHESLPCDGRGDRSGPVGRRKGPQAHRKADPRHQPGRGEHSRARRAR